MTVPIMWLPDNDRRSYWREDLATLRKRRRRLDPKAAWLIAAFLIALVVDAAIVIIVLHLLGKL